MESIILAPSRNMITFSEITQIDYKICSKELNLILEYIKSVLASINYLGLISKRFFCPTGRTGIYTFNGDSPILLIYNLLEIKDR